MSWILVETLKQHNDIAHKTKTLRTNVLMKRVKEALIIIFAKVVCSLEVVNFLITVLDGVLAL